jgi:hypothetical protein
MEYGPLSRRSGERLRRLIQINYHYLYNTKNNILNVKEKKLRCTDRKQKLYYRKSEPQKRTTETLCLNTLFCSHSSNRNNYPIILRKIIQLFFQRGSTRPAGLVPHGFYNQKSIILLQELTLQDMIQSKINHATSYDSPQDIKIRYKI